MSTNYTGKQNLKQSSTMWIIQNCQTFKYRLKTNLWMHSYFRSNPRILQFKSASDA